MYKHHNNLRSVDYFGIGVEHHENGELHHHALIVYTKRFNLTNPRYFDWLNAAGEPVHPSIEAARCVEKVLNYITKEGYEFHEWGDRPVECHRKIGGSDIYEEAQKMDYIDFMNACRREKIPYAYAQDAQARKKSLLCTIKPGDPVKGHVEVPLDTFTYDFEAGKRSLVLVGPTGVGKTTWAKLHLPRPILVVRCLETLKLFQPGHHKSILFDDMSFNGWNRDVQVYLVDRYDVSGINVKHGSVLLDTDAVRMFTNNGYPFNTLPEINRRVDRRNIRELQNDRYTMNEGSYVEEVVPEDVVIARSLRPDQYEAEVAMVVTNGTNSDPSPVADPNSVASPPVPRTPKREGTPIKSVTTKKLKNK